MNKELGILIVDDDLAENWSPQEAGSTTDEWYDTNIREALGTYKAYTARTVDEAKQVIEQCKENNEIVVVAAIIDLYLDRGQNKRQEGVLDVLPFLAKELPKCYRILVTKHVPEVKVVTRNHVDDFVSKNYRNSNSEADLRAALIKAVENSAEFV